jgi:hypothetical protein
MVALPPVSFTVSLLAVLVLLPVLVKVTLLPLVTVQFTSWYPVAGVAAIAVAMPYPTTDVPDGVAVPFPPLFTVRTYCAKLACIAASADKVTVVFAALAFPKVADPAVRDQFSKPQPELGVAARAKGVPEFTYVVAGYGGRKPVTLPADVDGDTDT